MINTIPTISYEYEGGSEDLSFQDFAREYIEDFDEAIELIEQMKETGEAVQGEGTEFYSRYTILNHDVLDEQIVLEEELV